MSVTVDMVLILVAVAGAVAFVVTYLVVADVRRWTPEGWNWWLVSLAIAALGVVSIADDVWAVPDWLDHAIHWSIYGLFALLTWHRELLLLTAPRRDARRRAAERIAPPTPEE